MRVTWLLFTIPLLFAAACVVPDGMAEPEPEPQPEPEPLVCDGSYQVESVLDIQAAAVLPQQAYDAVELIRGLRDNPAETLFDLAEDAGVPAVEEVRDALPSYLEDRLYGWIDGELATYTHGDAPIAVLIERILAVAEAVIAELRLSSDLTVEDGAAVHRLREIAFAIDELEIRQDLASFGGILDLDESPTATVTPTGDTATLALGTHSFGLPYGELALAALDAVLQAELGTDLRGALGLLIDCPRVAHAIATRCYLSQCVGHESQLAAICEGGLDFLAAEIDTRIGAMRFDAIRLQSGAAVLADTAPADGHADTLTAGVWTATIDAGMGPRTAPGTFTGRLQ
jgi:hypothetical protein